MNRQYRVGAVRVCLGVAWLVVAAALAWAMTPGAEKLQVTAPNGGETFKPGQSVKVTWTAEGLAADAQVEIRLRPENGDAVSLGQAAAKAGGFAWKVAADCAAGGYRIEVRLVVAAGEPELADASDETFQIAQ